MPVMTCKCAPGLLLAIALLGPACTDVPDDDAADNGDSGGAHASSHSAGDGCTPGASVACSCANGAMGAQVCDEDGEGFGACMCDGGGDGADDGDDGADGGAGDGADDGVDDGDGGGGDGDDDGTDESGTGGVPVVSFQGDIVPILQTTCGAATAGCHEPAAYAANPSADCRGWLALLDEPLGSQIYGGPNAGQPTGCDDFTLHERLVDIGAWSCSPTPQDPGAGGGVIKRFVVPGDPSTSYLLQRITFQSQPCALPDDAMPMPPVGTIAEEDVALIELWIAQGALDN